MNAWYPLYHQTYIRYLVTVDLTALVNGENGNGGMDDVVVVLIVLRQMNPKFCRRILLKIFFFIYLFTFSVFIIVIIFNFILILSYLKKFPFLSFLFFFFFAEYFFFFSFQDVLQ